MTHWTRVCESVVAGAVLIVGISGCASARGGTVSERRQSVQNMRASTLAELYQKRPESKAKVESAAGCGVFSNVGSKVLLLATGNGYGIVRDAATGRDTYMRMLELGGGLGLGVKKYKAVFIFHDPVALRTFLIEGWEVGGDADAAAQAGSKGGSVGVQGTSGQLEGLEVYTFTEAGLALSATAAAAKYYPDKTLN